MKPHSKARRTHRLGSCQTCRRRHVRCDTRRPACETCSALGLRCEGFTDEIQWSRNTTKDGPVASFGVRRQLLTEQARRSMALALSSGLVSGSVDESLDEIDSKSINLQTSSSQEARVGPFSVFLFSCGNSPLQDTSSRDRSGQLARVSAEEARLEPAAAHPDPSMDELLQWADFLEFGDGVPFDLGPALDLPTAAFGDPLLDSSPSCQLFDQCEGLHDEPPRQIGGRSAPEATFFQKDLLEQAAELLRNFQKNIIPQITMNPVVRKSPWKVVNMPAALVTLGDLTVMVDEQISHARQAHLYAVLACSAIELTTTPASRPQGDLAVHWKQVSEQAYEQGKYHMKISLSEESEGCKKAKLKDQLMALYALTQFAIFTGQDRDARRYLVDAERLLRLRGIPKASISRKLRILLNVYCWLRIVSESTYVLHDYTMTSEGHDTSAQNQSAHNHSIRLDNFLHIEDSEHDLNIYEPKNKRLDITDIHLQDSRFSSETLGRQVYGLPETWLSLLSQTTRLANVMEALKRTSRSDSTLGSATHRALEERASRLETAIHSFRARATESDYPNEQERSYQLVLQAFNSALLIFFYRRVRHVHPAILQTEIGNVVTALTTLRSALGHGLKLGLGLLWPLFVSGCEATSPEQQNVILELLKPLEINDKLAPLERARAIFSEIWRKRDKHSAVGRTEQLPTWVDVCKEQNIWAIFS